jgi:hypothetical protein
MLYKKTKTSLENKSLFWKSFRSSLILLKITYFSRLLSQLKLCLVGPPSTISVAPGRPTFRCYPVALHCPPMKIPLFEDQILYRGSFFGYLGPDHAWNLNEFKLQF